MWLKIILAFIIYNTVKSKRLVINTTCLELSKPSNQQFRLSCMDSSEYHCLLDRDSVNEYEVCRKWKWIPAGECAYFNTYGDGNIDGRPCINSTNFVCPEDLHSSKENTKYPACYVKNTTSTIAPIISSFKVTSETTTEVTADVTFHDRISIASPISDTTDKQYEIAGMTSAVIFGAISPFLLITMIYFFCKKRRRGIRNDLGLRRIDETVESKAPQQDDENCSTRENENNGALQIQHSENDSNEDTDIPEHQKLIKNGQFSTRETEGPESRERETDHTITEQQSLLNEKKTSSKNTLMMRDEMENRLAGERIEDDEEKEPSAENPANLCSGSVQHDAEEEANKETIVNPDEKRCTEPSLDDKKTTRES